MTSFVFIIRVTPPHTPIYAILTTAKIEWCKLYSIKKVRFQNCHGLVTAMQLNYIFHVHVHTRKIHNIKGANPVAAIFSRSANMHA